MTQPTSSAPTRQRKPRPKPQRYATLHCECDTRAVSLKIRQVTPTGKETIDVYGLLDIGTDEANGRGFALTKEDGTTYHVEITPTAKTCDCKGGARHGHCKHGDALAALLGKGLLGGFTPGAPELDGDANEDMDEYDDAYIDALADDYFARWDAA